MKVSFNWLKEFIDIALEPKELGDKLSMAGLVVESLEADGDDWVFEFESLANRPDWLSVRGIVREIAAITGAKAKPQEILLVEDSCKTSDVVSVSIENPDLCLRYAARVVKGVRVEASPQWLVDRLRKSGIRSVNNVVDVTNYVLLEYGHPLHAFDLAKVAGAAVIVRTAKESAFVTLDGVSRTLKPDMLVVANGSAPMALAGIMGGQESEVTTGTVDLLLESAYFKPASVRMTSRSLALSTEASYRFERGADIDAVLKALDRAAYLIQDLAGGDVLKGAIDCYPAPMPCVELDVSVAAINQLLGLALSVFDVSELLKRLDFEVSQTSDDCLHLIVPNCRREVSRLADVAEEVARVYGYANIPVTVPAVAMQHNHYSLMDGLYVYLRRQLVRQAWNEVINYSFVHPKDQKELKEGSIRLALPLSEDQSVMRRSLVPGLVKNLTHNIAHNVVGLEQPACFFELGQVYFVADGQSMDVHVLSLLTTQDYRSLKGAIEVLFDSLGLAGRLSFRVDDDAVWCDHGESCDILVDGHVVGYLGALSASKRKHFGIKENRLSVQVAELELDLLLHKVDLKKHYAALPKFPAAHRDLVLLMKEEYTYGDVMSEIEALRIATLKSVQLFDIYRGEQIPDAHKSLGFALLFQDAERTLTDAEVERDCQAILDSLRSKYGMTLRDR